MKYGSTGILVESSKMGKCLQNNFSIYYWILEGAG